MHFSFAFEAIDAADERLAIGADGAAQGFIGIKNCAKFEGKDGGVAEAIGYNSCVLKNRPLV